MESMYEEIYAVVDNFHSRLDKMNALLKSGGGGIFFPDKPIIEPGELLHWESNLEKTNDIIEEQLIAIEEENYSRIMALMILWIDRTERQSG